MPMPGVEITSDNIGKAIQIARWRRGGIVDTQAFARDNKNIAYSPDGKRIVVGTSIGVFVFDVETWEELLFLPVDNPVQTVGISADGNFVGAATYSKVSIWYISDGSLAYEFEDDGGCLAFSPTSVYLATCSEDINLWDLADGSLVNTFTGHTLAAEGVIFAPDGGSIFSFANVVVFQTRVPDGELLQSFSAAPAGFGVASISISPDGATLAVAIDNSIQLYDVAAEKTLLTLKPVGYGLNMIFSPDSQLLVTAAGEGSIGIWEVASGTKLPGLGAEELDQIFENAQEGELIFTSRGGTVDFSPDGKTLLQVEQDSVRLWSWEDMNLLYEKVLFSSPTYGLTLSSDGKTLAFVEDLYGGLFFEGQAVMVDLPGGEQIERSIVSSARNIVFLPENQTLVVIDKDVKFMSLEGDSSPQVLSGNAFASQIAVSSDGTLLAFDNGSDVNLLDTETGKITMTFASGNKTVTGLEFSPDGQYIALSGQNSGFFGFGYSGATRVYRISDGSLIQQQGPDVSRFFPGARLAFSPDGQYLATTDDNLVYVWKIPAGEEFFIDDSYSEFVNCVAFSPDSSLVAVGTLDGEIRVLNVIDGELLATLVGHTGKVNDLLFSYDGTLLFSSSDDGTIRIWGIKP